MTSFPQEGEPIATITVLTQFMTNGAGGLQFRIEDGASMQQLVEGPNHEHWGLWPVDVLNVDGWHYGCVLIVTITMHTDDKPLYHWMAVDPAGQPVAYTTC
jgi:hypothetical protein